MNTKTKQQKCVSGNFKRMNYFHGMLLTEQDFRDEQAYIREKLKLHNRLHGSGVVWGLCLVDKCIEITPQNEKITKIFIEPGLALDCSGNEIVVCHDFLVPIGDKVKKLKDCNQLSDPPPKLYIGIKYCECQSEPAEQLTAECDDDQLRPQFSRVREGFDVVILTEEEYYNCTNGLGEQNGKTHGCDCAGIPPCSEEELTIFLGCVKNYDVSGDPPNHGEATITNFDNTLSTPSHIAELLHPAKNWERHKQAMLSAALKNTDFGEEPTEEWVDISFLIGKSVKNFEKLVKELKLKKGSIFSTASADSITPENWESILKRARTALPYAKRDNKNPENSDEIDVVTDRQGKCIVFPLVAEKRRGS